MWAYPTRKEVGWFFDERINQTVFKRGKLSSTVQARFEEIGKWLKVHCEPQIMELERRMDAMLSEREVKSLRAKPKNLRAKPKRPVFIKKESVHPHLIPLEDWLKLKNQGGKKELLAYKQKMWAAETGPKMVQDGENIFVRILALNPTDPMMRNPVLAREGKTDTAEGKLQGVEKEVCRDFILISPSDNTQVPGLVFGPELPLREVKSQVSSPSLPSRTFSRAKRERIRKGLVGERTLKKEEKKARRAARRAERRLARGDVGKEVKPARRVYEGKESVDTAIRKILGKTARSKVAAKSKVKVEKVSECSPGSNSSMRSIAHEARQERRVKKRGSGGSRAALVSLQETCNVGSQVTIADVGMEEWLEAPTPCDQDGQLTLDLSGPEQGPFEPMPPCMEFFKVERLSVMKRCLTISIYSPLSNDDITCS